jgi:hypothetical protein
MGLSPTSRFATVALVVCGAAASARADPTDNHYILDCANPCVAETRIGAPGAVATDAHGNVYFASSNVVFKLTPDGALLRIAGDGTPGFSGDGGPAIGARLDFPEMYPEREDDPYFHPLIGALAVDGAGNVYIGDAYNNRVRRIDADGIIVSLVGTGPPGYPGKENDLRFSWVQGLAAGPLGELYVAGSWGQVTRIDIDGSVWQVAARNCTADWMGPGVCGPKQMALGPDGRLYIPDVYGRIRRLSADGATTTVAGCEPTDGVFDCHKGEGTPALATVFGAIVFGVAVTSAAEVLVADTTSSCIRKVSADGIVTTFAGRCDESGFEGDGGAARQALLDRPRGLAVDSAGNVYIADTGNGRIRRVTPDGLITTVAGNGRPSGN